MVFVRTNKDEHMWVSFGVCETLQTIWNGSAKNKLIIVWSMRSGQGNTITVHSKLRKCIKFYKMMELCANYCWDFGLVVCKTRREILKWLLTSFPEVKAICINVMTFERSRLQKIKLWPPSGSRPQDFSKVKGIKISGHWPRKSQGSLMTGWSLKVKANKCQSNDP